MKAKRVTKPCRAKPPVWKPVNLEAYRALYEVSDRGQVRSIRKQILLRAKPNNTSKYLQVELHLYTRATSYKKRSTLKHPKHAADGHAYAVRFYVHRLVALTFVPNSDNKPFVNHKDGYKLNNRWDNLEWVTMEENNAEAIAIGLCSRDGVMHEPYNTGARSPVCKPRRRKP